jgi:hypothetical protein
LKVLLIVGATASCPNIGTLSSRAIVHPSWLGYPMNSEFWQITKGMSSLRHFGVSWKMVSLCSTYCCDSG